MQLQLRDQVRLREGAVGAVLVAHFPVVDDVVLLVLLVVPDDRRTHGDGLRGIDDDRQRLVVDFDQVARIAGDVGVIRYHARDFLALEPNLVGCQDGLRVVGERRHPGKVASRHHLAREDHPHAWNFPCPAGVDRLDAGVGERAAQDLHVKHPRQHDVVGVVAPAPYEAVVLDSLAACAEPTDLDLVQRLRHVSSSVSVSRRTGPVASQRPTAPT